MMTLDEAIKIAKKNGNPQLAEWLDELRYYRLFVDRYLKVTEPKYAGFVICDGKKYVCANPILKTKDKEGYCSFYGFREVEIDPQYEDGLSADRWIPVSERLPEESGRYLAYIINAADNSLRYAMTADFYSKLKEWAVDDEGASDNVVAWMPLPEPMKEVQDDD